MKICTITKSASVGRVRFLPNAKYKLKNIAKDFQQFCQIWPHWSRALKSKQTINRFSSIAFITTPKN